MTNKFYTIGMNIYRVCLLIANICFLISMVISIVGFETPFMPFTENVPATILFVAAFGALTFEFIKVNFFKKQV